LKSVRPAIIVRTLTFLASAARLSLFRPSSGANVFSSCDVLISAIQETCPSDVMGTAK
jgi:hypothetical protein